MMKHIYKLFLTLLFISAISCSKDDGPEDTVPTVITGGEIFRSQVVIVPVQDAVLSVNEYQGIFNGTNVVLMKADETHLMFSVAYATPLGQQQLLVPSLNLTVNYDVKEPIIAGTPDEVLEQFTQNNQSFLATLEGTPEAAEFQNAINSFNQVYENATDEDKQAVAVMYTANKELFDEILLADLSNSGKSVSAGDILILAEHAYGVYLMAGGAIAFIFAPTPLDKTLCAAVAVAGAIKTYKQFNVLRDQNLICVNVSGDGIFGTTNRNTNNTFLTLNNDVARNVSFETVERKLTTADASSPQSGAVSFFKDYNKYNYYAGKVNSGIAWINDNVPFCNFSLVPLEQLPATSPLVEENVTEGVFSNLSFSVNHPNLQLVNAQLASNGQLSLKVKIVGEPQATPVESTLNYSYSDTFNSFSGSIPIKVDTEIDLSGTWNMVITLGAGVCDEILLLDEGGSSLSLQFNDNNTITFLSDPSNVGLNGSGFTQTYNLTEENLSISVSSEDGSFTSQSAYDWSTNSFTGTYTDAWNGCTNTVTISKVN